MKNFRPFKDKSELITESKNHFPYRDRDRGDWVFALRDKYNSSVRTFRLKEDSEFAYDVEDGDVLDWDTFYENYTFLDGSPCGMFEKVSGETESECDCLEEASLYEQIQALPIEPSLKEHLLEQVRSLNKLNSQLEYDLHNCRIEVENMKEIIFNLTSELYGR